MNPLGMVFDELALLEWALRLVQFALAVVAAVAVLVCSAAARCCLSELFSSTRPSPHTTVKPV